MGLFSYFFPQTLYRSSSFYNKNIEVRSIHNQNELLVNGIQQTGVYTEKLWEKGVQLLFSIQSSPPRDILIFGIGGGTLFHTFHKMYSRSLLTGVDVDEEIISIGNKYFGLESLENISLICQDARLFVKNKKQNNNFDLIIIDMYIGNDVPDFVTSRTFLAGVKKLLRKNGSLVINYFSYYNQPEKSVSLKATLSSIFDLVYMERVLKNVFFVLK